MSTLHLFGFEQWLESKSAGKIENPSELLVRAVKNNPVLVREMDVDRVRTAILPVPPKLRTFSEKLRPILDSIDVRCGDLCLAFGQGAMPQKSHVLESRFVNQFKPVVGNPQKINMDDDADRVVGLGGLSKTIVRRVNKAGFNIDVGVNAGNFYCNALGYITFQKLPLGNSLFVHLPALSDAETAEKIWYANEVGLKSAGITTLEEMPYSSPEQNIELFKALIDAWKI